MQQFWIIGRRPPRLIPLLSGERRRIRGMGKRGNLIDDREGELPPSFEESHSGVSSRSDGSYPANGRFFLNPLHPIHHSPTCD
jgi:hypothetical protein